MKSTIAYTTIFFYSLFSFAFAALCPAVCSAVEPQAMCSQFCGEAVPEESSCCGQACGDNACAEVDALAYCYGAYATQNSFRADCDCPVPDRSPVMAEPVRILKQFTVPPGEPAAAGSPQPAAHGWHVPLGTPSQFIAQVIAVTVLRI